MSSRGARATEGALESWEMLDLEASMNKLLSSSDTPTNQQIERDRMSQIPFASSSSSHFNEGEVFPSPDQPDGVDRFLREALQGKDRLTILRLEQEVERFLCSPKMQQLEFHPMPSSYLRLVAHRVVQHYNLQSSVADSSMPDGARIIAMKTADTRLPRIRLADVPIYSQMEEKQASSSEQRFELKRRPNKSSKYRESNGSAELSGRLNPRKSVEERKEEYNRARARIFNSSGGTVDEENLMLGSLASFTNGDLHYDNRGQQSSDAIARGQLWTANGKSERGFSALHKVNNKVAIFRDREKDRKDPDYDRNHNRYMQHFEPGFGVSQCPPYGGQALYSPAVNYNTEFPQLGGSVEPTMCVDPRATNPAVRGPWANLSYGLSYGHPNSMMGSFNSGHLTSQLGSGAYVHPQQFPLTATTMTYLHPQGHFPQSAAQRPHLPEGSFGQARRQ